MRSARLLPTLVSLTLLTLLSACASPPLKVVEAVKLIVDEDALYQVTAAELAGVGFDLAGASPEQVTLSTGGTPVVFEITGDGRNATLQFYGLRFAPDAYSPRNVYWLRRVSGTGTPQSPSRPHPTVTPDAGSDVISATVRLEQDLQYDGQAERLADRWYWQTLFAPAQLEVELSAPGIAPGVAELRVFVVSKSSAPVDPDHRLLITLNGAMVSDAPWDGVRPHLITDDIPPGLLKEDDNKLVISAPGDTGAAADSVQVQWIEVTYPQVRKAAGSKPRSVIGLAPVTASSLPEWPGGADLVIVTIPQFREAIQPLVAARETRGLRVAVLDVEQVYDAFSHGRTEPAAIQSLMRYATQNWPAPAPRYLLLAGDASYDPLNRTGGPEVDIIPTQVVYTTFSGWTGSDVWFALPDDGETTKPVLPVGRLPAQTAEQLAVMVQKTLEYERQTGDLGWRSSALLVADNDEPEFAEETGAFAARLGYDSQQVTIDGDGTNARTALHQAFDDGAGLIGYFGHGSITLWGKEKIFGVEQAAKLDNAARLPIVFTVTCLSGFFEHPSTVSLGETLLRRANGGAVAALVPSSAAVLTDQRLLAQGLAGALAKPGPRPLGDIVHDAQLALPEQAGGVRDILLTFNLLGDPSLKIQR